MPKLPHRGQESAPLLHFLLPGLMHGLGNALFSIQGHAQVIDTDGTNVSRERTAILKAAEKANHALEVLRLLQDDSGAIPCSQAGVLLRRLCEFIRVPLRERGVRSSFRHSSTESPAQVDGVTLCRTLVETVRNLVAILPSGFEGAIEFDLTAQRKEALTVSILVQGQPARLPFPLDLGKVVQESRALLDSFGTRLEGPAEDGALRLRVPTMQSDPAIAELHG